MIFPIPNVPLAVEFVKSRYSDLYNPTSGRIRRPSREVAQHVCDTVRYVWRRIPAEDRRIMVADMSTCRNKRLYLWFDREWPQHVSNGFINYFDRVIYIDLSYARLAVKQELGATIAHELGHYRDLAEDPQTVMNEKRVLTEDQAWYFAITKWGFPSGEVIFKCDASRFIESEISKRGITGNVFWDAYRQSFVYFRDGERLHVGGHDGHELDTDIRESLDILLTDSVHLSFRTQKAKIEHQKWLRIRNRQLLSFLKARDVIHPGFVQWKRDIQCRMRAHPGYFTLVEKLLPSPEVAEMWEYGESVEEMVVWCEKELSAPDDHNLSKTEKQVDSFQPA